MARLVTEGPTVPVAIGLPSSVLDDLQQHDLPAPPPVVGNAPVDTGASLCCTDEDAVEALGIPPFGVQPILTPSGQANQPTYPASLSFPSTTLPNVSLANFIGSPLQAQGIVAIIGRNVLQSFVLIYNGPCGMTRLSY